MARIHPPLENWRRVSGEIRTEPLISSGNIRRLQREERPRGDPAGRSPRRLPSRPRKAKYISGAVYQHTLRHTDLALRKPKKAYKNRVLKILVPLRYREKLDTNVVKKSVDIILARWYIKKVAFRKQRTLKTEQDEVRPCLFI